MKEALWNEARQILQSDEDHFKRLGYPLEWNAQAKNGKTGVKKFTQYIM